MTRLRSVPIAVGVLALSAGVVAAFNALPEAATTGLEKAGAASGGTLPARPAELPTTPRVQAEDLEAVDLPDAATHGAAVSIVATSDDPTPDTNHGADVSAVAKDNHGQAVAADKKSEGAGKPEGAGRPEVPGVPADPGAPEGAGQPDGVGRP
jgi:hypothetical protein